MQPYIPKTAKNNIKECEKHKKKRKKGTYSQAHHPRADFCTRAAAARCTCSDQRSRCQHLGPKPGANRRVCLDAVMTVLANLLQKCLSMEYHRDVAEQNSLGHEGKGGFRVGLTSPDLYRAMLHRLSHMLALQRGIEKDTTIQSTDRSVRSSETDLFASAVASLPSVQVDTWLSAVESVFAEDDSQAASRQKMRHRRFHHNLL